MTPGKALITGGSEGIGFAIAKRLVLDGWSVVLVARSREKLASARGKLLEMLGDTSLAERVETVPVDVTDATERRKLADRYTDHVTLLVNNAGVGYRGYLDHQNFHEVIAPTIETNCTALADLSRLFLMGLHRHQGYLINISSILSAFPVPTYALYAASKAFVTYFSEALRQECRMRGLRVSVLTVLPTTTRTAFFQKGDSAKAERLPSGADADVLARDIVRAMRKRRAFYVHGIRSHLFLLLSRLFGWRFSAFLTRVFYR